MFRKLRRTSPVALAPVASVQLGYAPFPPDLAVHLAMGCSIAPRLAAGGPASNPNRVELFGIAFHACPSSARHYIEKSLPAHPSSLIPGASVSPPSSCHTLMEA